MNKSNCHVERARRAVHVLDHYKGNILRCSGPAGQSELTGLLADLIHLAQGFASEADLDIAAALSSAVAQYEEESGRKCAPLVSIVDASCNFGAMLKCSLPAMHYEFAEAAELDEDAVSTATTTRFLGIRCAAWANRIDADQESVQKAVEAYAKAE